MEREEAADQYVQKRRERKERERSMTKESSSSVTLRQEEERGVGMDAILCEELIHEIFHRLPPSSKVSASLVSHRWRSLLLSSLTSLTLRLPHSSPQLPLFYLSPFLTSLSSLTLLPTSPSAPPITPTPLLLSLLPHRLHHLRLLLGSVHPSTLLLLRNLRSLHLSSLRPLSFHFLLSLPLLRDLSIHDCSSTSDLTSLPLAPADSDSLHLESISLAGIRAGDFGFGWLWTRCPRLRTLRLRACEGTGDGDGTAFSGCLRGLRRLELRTCRTIADGVLRLAAELSPDLDTLVLYDGGSRDGLRGFVSRTAGSLRALDLRLPLDLDDSHLEAVAGREQGPLRSLRLQSCCLVTAEGLRRMVRSPAVGCSLEELSLVNCDVVEKEMGLLTLVGQSLRGLRRVDLSYNENLKDRELGGMVAACGGRVVEIRVRGCGGLSGAAMASVARWCKAVEELDLRGCVGIMREGVDVVVRRCRRLRMIWVESSKIGETCSNVAKRRGIQICS